MGMQADIRLSSVDIVKVNMGMQVTIICWILFFQIDTPSNDIVELYKRYIFNFFEEPSDRFW